MRNAFAAVLNRRGIIVHDLLQIHCGHHAVARRIHVFAIDPVCIEDRNVKRVLQLRIAAEALENILPNRIALVFKRTIEPAVAIAKIDAAEMPEQTGHAADQIALQIGLHQLRCKRIIDEAVLTIHRDSLTVPAVPHAGINRIRHVARRLRRHKQRGNQQQAGERPDSLRAHSSTSGATPSQR